MTKSPYIHPSAIVELGAFVGNGTKIWHFCHLMPGASVGEQCSLGQNVVVMPEAVIGNGCRVQNNVTLYTGVVCEDDVFLGPSCVFTNVVNPRAFVCRKDQYKATLLRRGASIGANATILCGNTIGTYALVGAGSVVTKDVPAYALVQGIPARIVGWVSRLGHQLSLTNPGDADVCPESGEHYCMKEDGLVYPVQSK